MLESDAGRNSGRIARQSAVRTTPRTAARTAVRTAIGLLIGWAIGVGLSAGSSDHAAGAERSVEAALEAGFSEADITPVIKPGGPVWLAGYGMGRKATGVHDPLIARCVVLKHGADRIAWVSLDLVGFQYPDVRKIRERLPEFKYVMVSSTHNHEGPDVIGIWGRSPIHRGVDPTYVQMVIDRVVTAVKTAAERTAPVRAAYGTAEDERLLGDSRLPHVKDGVLRVLRFMDAQEKVAGLVVQWNCHPEALGARNTLITADFPYATVAALKKRYDCPVVYLSGALGGLMAPPDGVIFDADGKELKEGDFRYAEKYGEAVAELAGSAIDRAAPIQLTPLVVSAKPIAVPVENKLYRLARIMGVLQRGGRLWTGDPENLGPVMGEGGPEANQNVRENGRLPPLAIETEVAYLRLGELHVACIPGELYPELVYGKIQEPVEPNADFPDAPREPHVAEILPGAKWMLFGLANDEIGYIMPKRQWDNSAPYAYGRETNQYGEINSCSAEIGPIVMAALKRRVAEAAERP